jgi:hypothetical protein
MNITIKAGMMDKKKLARQPMDGARNPPTLRPVKFLEGPRSA